MTDYHAAWLSLRRFLHDALALACMDGGTQEAKWKARTLAVVEAAMKDIETRKGRDMKSATPGKSGKPFRCWAPDNGETEDSADAADYTANDAERAAAKYAEDYFNAYAASPKDLIVAVREDGPAPAGRVRRWLVEAEYSVNYYAREERVPATVRKIGGSA